VRRLVLLHVDVRADVLVARAVDDEPGPDLARRTGGGVVASSQRAAVVATREERRRPSRTTTTTTREIDRAESDDDASHASYGVAVLTHEGVAV
jgi:hypothetical protein